MARAYATYYIVLSTVGLVLLATYMIKAILPYIALGFSTSQLDISRVLYIGLITIPLTTILTGYLCDKYNPVIILIIISILAGLAVSLYLILSNIFELLYVRFIHALLGDMVLAIGLVIASEATSKGYVGIGFLRFVEGLGIALGPMLAFTLSYSGYNYVIIAALIFTLMPIASVYLRKDFKRSRGEYIDVSTALSILKNTKIMVLSVIALIECIGFIVLTTYYSSYLVVKLGFTVGDYALLLMVESLSFSVSSYFSEGLYRRYERSTVITSVIVGSIALALLSAMNTKLLIILSMMPIGIASAFMFNSVYVEVSIKAIESRRGLIINSLDFLIDLIFLTPPLLELLIPFTGIRGLLLIPVIISIPTLIAYTIVTKSTKQENLIQIDKKK